MKRKPKNDFNAIHMFLGLLLGFFLGSTVVYWNFNRQNDRIFVETADKLMSLFSTQDSVLQSTADLTVLPLTDTINTATSNDDLLVAQITTSQSAVLAEVILQPIHNQDTINDTEQYIPHTHGNSTDEYDHDTDSPVPQNPPTFQIAQDRLLHTKTMSIAINQRVQSATEARLDSLMGNTVQSPKEQILYLEFWESPLNSLGYKMGKNKIVFYGVHLYDLASISQENGKLYLKYLNHHYPLNITNSFKPLIPVSETLPEEEIQNL